MVYMYVSHGPRESLGVFFFSDKLYSLQEAFEEFVIWLTLPLNVIPFHGFKKLVMNWPNKRYPYLNQPNLLKTFVAKYGCGSP